MFEDLFTSQPPEVEAVADAEADAEVEAVVEAEGGAVIEQGV